MALLFIDKKTNKELEYENTYENRDKNHLKGFIENYEDEEKATLFLTWLVVNKRKEYALFLHGEYFAAHGQDYITVH